MVAMFRLLLKLIRKEHLLLTNYHRAHPHFLWYMILDAILSMGLILGGFGIAHAGSAWKSASLKLEDSGAKAISADQLIARYESRELKAYWLGSISGASYSSMVKSGVEYSITYLVGGKNDLKDFHLPKLVIETYATQSAYTADLHPVLATGAESKAEAVNYTQFFDSNFMLTSTVVFKNSSRIVVIHYPMATSRTAMIEDASALSLI